MIPNARIFLLEDLNGGGLRPVGERRFPSEDYLQKEIERRPDLLPGDQIDPESPRRWLPVARQSLSSATNGSRETWTFDHMLVDQDAIPTLVECRLVANSEARMVAVARLLDYAANARRYWPGGRMREAARTAMARANRDLELATADLIDSDDPAEIEQFWERADQNLADGWMRVVLVGDSFPDDLWRLVDFLATQMTRTEIVAVEVKLFEGEGVRVLVPRALVRHGHARPARRVTARRRVTEESLLAGIQDPEYRAFAGRLFSHCRQAGLAADYGDIGISWKTRSAVPFTVCWFLPPGVRGVAGLTDLTTGYDRAREADAGPAADALRRFADRVRAVPAHAEPQPWINGARFTEESAPIAEQQILQSLTQVASALLPRQAGRAPEPAEAQA